MSDTFEPNASSFGASQPSSVWSPEGNSDLNFVNQVVDKVRDELEKVLVGQEHLVDSLVASMLVGGHVLLEGVPGVAKTMTVNLLSKALKTDFRRIQFTPDLMPSDVVGTNVFNVKTSEFSFHAGPIFSNVVLVDEINRAPAKTQAALFEVMEERQVTVDGETRKMGFPFFIVATQNPIEQEGTYRLPEAQLDRFLFKVHIHYPTMEEEVKILQRFKTDFTGKKNISGVEAVVTPEELKRCMEIVESVHIKDELLRYIAQLIEETRVISDLYLGASPRASLSLLKASKAYAAMRGRDFVTPDDIRDVSVPVLNHRIVLNPDQEIEGVEPEDVIREIISKVEVPR